MVHNLRRAVPSMLGVCRQSIKACAQHADTTIIHSRSFTSSNVLSKAQSDALRILFCGSDTFSCESLKALHTEHQRNKALVEQLEVMVLPGKRMGRGYKEIAQVPCKDLAQELGLKIHEKETFRGWKLPQGINLVVAVSFGLFVPPRILSSARYGGLNVHPSLLPHLRGPAPIHHAYLRGDQYTGVSLQTLDPTAFDHGTILAQTPAPGVRIPKNQKFPDLKRDLAVRGAAMLVQGLRDGVHVPPHEAVAGWAPGGAAALVHAPKMTKADTEVDWKTWRADDAVRRLSAFGAVWTCAVGADGSKDAGLVKRVLLTEAKAVTDAAAEANSTQEQLIWVTDKVKKHVRVKVDAGSGRCYFEFGDGTWLEVEKAKMEGEGEKKAAVALRTLLGTPP
ncbi:hypothetical protein LMH87_000894 [Akanthomyces muscarius]|uniref:methionyl-tRNA formyltransferase n=1 Tax=Akanthomyces muscarius TaxID=2231603 RepID=A0A9W8ULI8_AKAMU|nr:hypothetical protein LMH87_000894 [Akanthomyces muscarius]KAJ4155658.1 hypothetical protein LMH87_000894 [Akanthomyces muscarius]